MTKNNLETDSLAGAKLGVGAIAQFLTEKYGGDWEVKGYNLLGGTMLIMNVQADRKVANISSIEFIAWAVERFFLRVNLHTVAAEIFTKKRGIYTQTGAIHMTNEELRALSAGTEKRAVAMNELIDEIMKIMDAVSSLRRRTNNYRVFLELETVERHLHDMIEDIIAQE